MKIYDKILSCLIDYLIESLENDILCDTDKLSYGQYKFYVYTDTIIIKLYYKDFYRIEFVGPPFNIFFNKKKKRLLKLWYKRKKVQEEKEKTLIEKAKKDGILEKNKQYIESLPREKQEQLLRELKLEKILK